MKKGWIIVTALFIIIVLGVLALIFIPRPAVVSAPGPDSTATTTPSDTTNPLSDTIVVDTPSENTAVQSPLTISGKARGSWYFEASAPVALLDSNGGVIAQDHITAQGDWMTTDFVPFTATLTFPAQPAGSSGTLVLTNDNPSGDPANQKTLDIPVTF